MQRCAKLPPSAMMHPPAQIFIESTITYLISSIDPKLSPRALETRSGRKCARAGRVPSLPHPNQVCLLNASATGSEVLKNLVLGNIGSFTVVDGARVTSRDLGNNFLVEASSLGASRAATVTTLLRELNDSVDGKYVEEDPGNLVHNPDFFKSFTLVIATQIPEAQVLKIDEICRSGAATCPLSSSGGLSPPMPVSRR